MKSIKHTTENKKPTKHLAKNAKILSTINQAIENKKGENILQLDLRKIPEAVADFFIICEATTAIQIEAIAQEVLQKVKENCDEIPFRNEGRKGKNWVIIDYVNVVVHIMRPDIRKFYKLEEMWG